MSTTIPVKKNNLSQFYPYKPGSTYSETRKTLLKRLQLLYKSTLSKYSEAYRQYLLARSNYSKDGGATVNSSNLATLKTSVATLNSTLIQIANALKQNNNMTDEQIQETLNMIYAKDLAIRKNQRILELKKDFMRSKAINLNSTDQMINDGIIRARYIRRRYIWYVILLIIVIILFLFAFNLHWVNGGGHLSAGLKGT